MFGIWSGLERPVILGRPLAPPARCRCDLFDGELANAFLHPNVFDGVPDFVCETDFLRHRLADDSRGGDIGVIEIDIFDAETRCQNGWRVSESFTR